jgi:diguanylate cyclase (GGDEF)-like protein
MKKTRWFVLIPAGLIAILNIISIFTGIVFSIDASGELQRGVLGYLPYIGVGLYSVALVFILIWQSNKTVAEIVPIAFLAFAFISGLIFPFVIGKEYSKIFCTTIAIALFVYYVFLILQLTKKDALTGLFNRQAYYAYIKGSRKDITALISIDMNGLKEINDNHGHLAGDEALTTLANCFTSVTNNNHLVYRLGGDEFIIICRKTNEEELKALVERIKESVSNTKYSCAIGYSYDGNESKDIEDMAKESDKMMYKDKAAFYSKSGNNRRVN